jgi:deoxyribose-phosphate aldolase
MNSISMKVALSLRVKLMKASCGPGIKVKAADRIYTVDEFLYIMYLRTSRIGTSGTVGIMEEVRKQGIMNGPTEVQLKATNNGIQGGAY